MKNHSEQPVPFAPLVKLENGVKAVPQHFLQYHHSRQTVEELLSEVSFSEQFPLFVDNDSNGLYLQVGIIGSENYANSPTDYQPKIVYGRKWRIEANLPTSEILQTAFLALKCAYEHELRELVRLRINNGKNWATPFNNHFDLPLMSASTELLTTYSCASPPRSVTLENLRLFIEQVLTDVRLGHQWLSIRQLQLLDDDSTNQQRCVIDLQTSELIKHSHLSGLFGLQGLHISLLETLSQPLNQAFADQLLYSIIEQLLCHAESYISENFMFRGFARFSRKNSAKKLAEFSFNVRNINKEDLHPHFKHKIHALNCEVDKSRVPSLSNDPLSNKNRALLKKYPTLEGYLPKGL